MKTFLSCISVYVLSSLPAGASAAVWYVDASVAESGDGRSQLTAFKAIQEGIDAATDGDRVIVAQGTYVENIRLKGDDIILTSTNPFDRAVVGSTVIDGNKAGSVVTFAGTETETCVLCGFTIQNGKADAGGGVCGGTADIQTYATIRNNVIVRNRADAG